MSQIAGPALAGVIIAAASVAAAYAIDIGSFVLSLTAFAFMRTPPPPPDAEPPSLRGVLEGVKYAGTRQELLGSYVIDMNAMFFGMPFALFPAFAERYGGTSVVGLLWAAPAVGGIAAMLTSGWSARVHHNGRAITLAAAAWGVGIVGFGLAQSLWLALAMLVVAGAGDGVSGIFRGALWNETIPDRLRGRLAGVEMISWSSGPLLGNARAGASAGWFGLTTAVVDRRRVRGRRQRRDRGAAPEVLELRLESVKPARRLVDDGEALAEREPQVGRESLRLRREHGRRDRHDTRLVGQLARERRRVGADVDVGEVRALRPRDGELAEGVAQVIALGLQLVRRTPSTTRRSTATPRPPRTGTASRPRRSGTAWPRARRRRARRARSPTRPSSR